MRLMRTASSPSLISISAMPDSSSSSISFLIFRMSMPGLPQEKSKTPTPLVVSGCTGEPRRGGAHCRFVAERAEAADHTDRDVREIRLPPKRLAGVRVRQMHLDERQPRGQNRVAQRNARVSEGRGVDDEEGHPLRASLVDALNELVLRVALEADQIVPRLACHGRCAFLDGLQALRSIYGRLPAPEQIEVRPFNNSTRAMTLGLLLL